MLQTLNPYTSTAKTAEIMARYRPIAPRPQAPLTSNGGSGDGDGSGSSPSSMSPTIRQSPYLRNVWPHLQSRPTRTRKRGRTSLGPPPPPTFKRPRTLLQGLSPPFHITTSPARNLSIQGFAPLPLQPTTTLVTLPLLPCSSSHPMQLQPNVIDLNKVADVPEEKDLLAQLQKPTTDVISPRPIRLIPSTVTIRAIKDDTCLVQVLKKAAAEEVEKELESQVLPAFVSDSNNQVRLVNSAYKEMVGQPECPWLESMMTVGVACKSICGEVVLNLEQDVSGSGGFSCWARIEWGMNGKKKKLVNAFGEAMRLKCESKDYKFAWRFHTREASEAASNV
ncbi:hypothetical protein L6452_06131 [Arctium lappa]|uniref:Uncharacterized protein n=1 Tax=Arctium lappa TaxID=4217 RepID=A0ACB9EI12_ARCLA|nr:hypothetical protein L6452_06131 [Arctium lappa]